MLNQLFLKQIQISHTAKSYGVKKFGNRLLLAKPYWKLQEWQGSKLNHEFIGFLQFWPESWVHNVLSVIIKRNGKTTIKNSVKKVKNFENCVKSNCNSIVIEILDIAILTGIVILHYTILYYYGYQFSYLHTTDTYTNTTIITTVSTTIPPIAL